MLIQVINKNSIIMMYIGFNHLINIIAEKKRFVVKVDLYMHSNNKDTGFWILDAGRLTPELMHLCSTPTAIKIQYPESSILLFLIFAA